MKRLALIVMSMAMTAVAQTPPAKPAPWNSDESKVGPYTLPDPLLCGDGSRVTDAQGWQTKRRGEILNEFSSLMYGHTPAPPPIVYTEATATRTDAVNGLATRTLVTLRFFDGPDAPRIHLMLYVPNAATQPVPVFLGLNYFGNACVEADPAIPMTDQWMMTSPEMGIVNNRATEATRGCQASRWPLELALRRGYAVATFFYGDIEPDNADGWRTGLRGYLMKRQHRTAAAPEEWGALGAWAWGLSRALDYLETNSAVDARRVAVFGHSRHGKAALWAGAQDERFALVISNDSGEGGASLARRDFGETIAWSIEHAAWRYCERFRSYVGRAADLPFDQHMLLALVAPRPVYIASATEDLLSDPRGEFLSAVHAAPVYHLFGYEGLGTAEWPAPDHPIGDRIGYHLRTGKHAITAYDWEQYLDFADRHLTPPPPVAGDIESVEPAGRFIYECTLPGHTRRDDVVPRAANCIQLSATRWLIIYATRGYQGVDDERSLIYQVRRDAPDGAVLKEGFLAEGEMDWKLPGLEPLAEGNVYYKQHGHGVAFGVPKGALIGGRPAPNANLFVAKWRVSARPTDVKTGFKTFQALDRTIGQLVEWMQFRLNDREDDIEILQPKTRLRQKGFETGEAFCSANVEKMNQSFCQPVPVNRDFTEWADVNHFDQNRLAVLKYRFNPESHRYEWVEMGPMIGSDPKRVLIEASLVHMPDEFIVSGRGIGEIAWTRSKDPFTAWSPLTFTTNPPGQVPHLVYRCADDVMRLFCNDIRTNTTRQIRNPLFCWDVDAAHGFASSDRREIFSVARGHLPIRPESHAKLDFPHLFPLQGRTQIVSFNVSMRAMNFPTEGSPDIPIQNAEEKEAAGVYYDRITYRKAPPPLWEFAP